MKLKRLKANFIDKLKESYTEKEAESLFFIMLEFRLGISRLTYISDNDKVIPDKDVEVLERDLTPLIEGKPWQYIVGKVEFCGLELFVNENTLIPRPETEELAEYIRKNSKSPQRVLDIGTGSGCLAIAMKHFYPSAEVWAIDISEPALAVAQKNAAHHKLDINFVQANILNGENFPNEKYDLLVSNPPYIAPDEAREMEPQVLDYEPKQALFAEGNDPLIFYRAIAKLGVMNAPVKIYLEINARYGAELVEMFSAERGEVRILKDLSGKDRFAEVSYK